MTAGWSVEAANLTCHRCGGSLHAMLRIPSSGPPGPSCVQTTRLVPLCPLCDRDEAWTQGLLAFFALHPQVCVTNVDEFVALIRESLRRLPPTRVVDTDEFDRDVEAWQRGEFDSGGATRDA